MDCDGEDKADSKPFSIRQFVADTRRKNVIHCWPFPKKYLEVCLKYGISNVLPPFEPCIYPSTLTNENIGRTCSDRQHKDQVSFENKVILPEKSIKEEFNYDEMPPKAPCHDSNLSFDFTSNITVPVNPVFGSVQGHHLNAQQRMKTVSPKRMIHKQRKRKGRRKKRSMSDILARAKSCTLDNCYRIRCNSINLSKDGNDEAIDDNLSCKNVKSSKDKAWRMHIQASKPWNIN